MGNQEELEMARVVDAVVIGAGINGASIAFNLAHRGLQNIAVIERHVVASGGTGRSAALIRQHYSNEVLVKMAKHSRDVFEHFADAVGETAGFVRTGYLFLVPDSVVERFRANVAMQRRLGVDTEIITRRDAASVAPQLMFDDAAGIAYERDSGYANPYDATVSYLNSARSQGAAFYQMSPVRAIHLRGGEVEKVVTDKEEFATHLAINVTGPWANDVGRMVGVRYPIQVTREQEVLFRARTAAQSPKITVSDMCSAIYFHPLGRDLLVGRGFPKDYEDVDPDKCPEAADFTFIEDTAARLRKRVPSMDDSACIHGYSGLYDVTPDWHPIIGRHAELKGFISCVGFSGHGFKLAPAVGEAVAELVLDGRAQEFDLDLFSLDRFEAGRQFRAAYGGNRA
jgi:sarcosine oxidase, subunit beta